VSEGAERSVPFFCPYCGEEDLEPVGAHGSWWCHDCNRRWTLKLVGAGPPPESQPHAGPPGSGK
jgi:transposase-like protein